MPTYAFRIVNVFAETPLAGNPLCVFEDARGLDDATMQALALQFNLSETTFVLPSDRGDGARAHLHADLRDAVRRPSDARHRARRARADAMRGDAVTLEMSAGVIPVEARGDVWTLQANAPRHRAPCGDARRARRDAGARRGRRRARPAAPPLWVDTGSEQLVIPLASADAVRRAAPRADLLLRARPAPASARWPTSSRRDPRDRRRRRRDGRAVLLSQARRGGRGSGHRLRLRQPRRLAARDRRAAAAAPRRSRRATRSAGRAGSGSRSPPTAGSACPAA